MIFLKNLYRLIPKSIRLHLRKGLKYFVYKYRFLNLKLGIYLEKDIKLILGAALTNQKGWFSTNEEWLDIANKKHWERLFHTKNSVNNIVAEHVFEHLTIDEMKNSINLIYMYLKKMVL